MTREWGGWWTEAKLEILDKYLHAFQIASKSGGPTVYLDLFAGKESNLRPDTRTAYPGSTVRALRVTPPFDRLVFWELPGPAEKLRADLTSQFPGDGRYEVVSGDCNATLTEGLSFVRDRRRSPTFAFIDPKGLDVAWTTLEDLSGWRRSRRGRKVELWILFPEPALARALGLDGVRGENQARRLTRLYGSDDWIAIHQRRRSGGYNPGRMRAEFVNLYRWRIEKVLGYRTTHALQLGNVSDHPVYTMIFATDVDAGHSIMGDIYDRALMREIPQLRAHAVSVRTAKRDLEKGMPRLFVPADEPASQNYEYVEPWEPPERLSSSIELGAEPPAEEEEPDAPAPPQESAP